MSNALIPYDPARTKVAEYIAFQTSELLVRSGYVRDEEEEVALYYWIPPEADRVVLIVNPILIRNINAILSKRFAHHLSAALQGRRVIQTNTRGVFLQVAFDAAPYRPLISNDLDLSGRPSPDAVPIGSTRSGDLWLRLDDLPHCLIAGASGMGKSNFLRTWIESLIEGRDVDLILFDGKAGTEFGRYASDPVANVIEGSLVEVLASVHIEMISRFEKLRASGATSIAAYNALNPTKPLRRIAIVLDELSIALEEEGSEYFVAEFAKRGRAAGIHIVAATQRASAEYIPSAIRANLLTRISFAVPMPEDSRTILGSSGAERIPKIAGRLLIRYGSRQVEAQAFRAPDVFVARKVADPDPIRRSESGEVSSTSAGSPTMDDFEAGLVRAAIEEFDGRFRIVELSDRFGIDKNRIVDAAKRLQDRGILSAPERAKGRHIGRAVLIKEEDLPIASSAA